jgi:hypothetical protein
LSELGVGHARHGRLIPRSEVLAETLEPEHEGEVRVAFDGQGRALALVGPSGDGLRVLRGFRRD